MILDEYQELAARTLRNDGPSWDLRVAVAALGLTGEAGEVADLLKKQIGHGHAADMDKLGQELGDVLWYVAALASLHGMSLEMIAHANIDKLRKRYPDGFSEERSRSRTE